MIDICGNFFYTRTVPCQLWFFDRAKERDPKRADHVLMLDARNIFRKVSRAIYDFSPEQQKNIAAIVWLYRGQMERFLKLVESYLEQAVAEGQASAEPLTCFEEALDKFINLAELIATGDVILISGDIGRHGMAVMGEREGLAFTTPIESDCAPLWDTVDAMLSADIDVHCMRDATRGGVCAVLNELAKASDLQFDVVERDIPVSESVRGACEVLGLDALQVACEGRFVAIVPKKDEARALNILKARNETASAVGRVTNGEPGMVTIQTPIGGRRILDMSAGQLLPRIC